MVFVAVWVLFFATNMSQTEEKGGDTERDVQESCE